MPKKQPAKRRPKKAAAPGRAGNQRVKQGGSDAAKPGERDPKAGIRRHQFKPGQSGNPSGRPKGSLNLTTRLIRALKTKKPKDPQGRRWYDLLVQSLLRELVSDPVRAHRILARLLDVDEGPITKEVALRGGGGTLAALVVAAEGGDHDEPAGDGLDDDEEDE